MYFYSCLISHLLCDNAVIPRLSCISASVGNCGRICDFYFIFWFTFQLSQQYFFLYSRPYHLQIHDLQFHLFAAHSTIVWCGLQLLFIPTILSQSLHCKKPGCFTVGSQQVPMSPSILGFWCLWWSWEHIPAGGWGPTVFHKKWISQWETLPWMGNIWAYSRMKWQSVNFE